MKLISLCNTDWYFYNYRLPVDNLLKCKGYEIVVVSPPGEYVEKIQKAGFRWRPIRMSRSGANPISEMDTIVQLVKIYQEERPDIVHHFTIKCNLYGAIAAKVAGITSVVNSIAGLGYIFASNAVKAKFLKPLGYWGYKRTLRFSKVIFQNSVDFKNFVEKGYVDDSSAYLIRSSGVDLIKFSPTPFQRDCVNILVGSRMLWTKGIGEFVEAARIVKAKYPHINLLLAGDVDPGNPASISKKQMGEWHEEGVVQWLGFQHNMAELINNCHVACFPSKHTEGTPKFLVEAAACGRPIITTNNRGCKEVVDVGKNGLLIPKGNASALAEAILTLVETPSLIEEMGRNSRRKAENEFSVQKVAEETHFVYQEVAAQNIPVYSTAIA